VVLGAIGIVLALVGFIGPWWVVNISASALGATATGTADFRLFGGTASIQTPAGSSTNTTDYHNDPNTGSVFLLASVVTAFGLVLGIGMVALAALSDSRPSFRRLAAILGILAFLVVLIGPLYVMAQLPSAANSDSGAGTSYATFSGFWGSQSTSFFTLSATITWAAGWAWYVVLIAAIVFLIGGIAMLRAPKVMPAVQTPAPGIPPPP
jgi:hypothetical protein